MQRLGKSHGTLTQILNLDNRVHLAKSVVPRKVGKEMLAYGFQGTFSFTCDVNLLNTYRCQTFFHVLSSWAIDLKGQSGAGAIVQQLKPLPVLPEELGSFPSTLSVAHNHL